MSEELDFSDLPLDSYPPLVLTGERTLPGVPGENYWFQRHLVAYEYLLQLVEGGKVLDLGSGEGYGDDLLASSAAEVTGVDLAPEAVYHARKTYRRANLRFEYMDIYHLELEDDRFDVVCSLQVVEHLDRPELFMAEARRVLRPGGICVLSTPNRVIISPGCGAPVNPFHIIEYDEGQFRAFVGSYFPQLCMLGVVHGRKLRLHDTILRRNFSQFCLEIPPLPNRLFYRPLFIPAISTRDFRIVDRNLESALDFIALGVKEGPEEEG